LDDAAGAGALGDTVMENAGSAARALPSLALMTMSGKLPALLGLPESVPFAILNEAQAGLFLIEYDSVRPAESLATGLKV